MPHISLCNRSFQWSRLATIIRNSFIHKNGNRRYKFLVLGREGPYFVKDHSDSKSKYTEDDIIYMLEFLVDNIFVVFWGSFCRHSNGHKLCPSPMRHFFCTQTKRTSYSLCSQLERKSKLLSSTSHTDISMTYCQSITEILRIIWVRCIPLNLR